MYNTLLSFHIMMVFETRNILLDVVSMYVLLKQYRGQLFQKNQLIICSLWQIDMVFVIVKAYLYVHVFIFCWCKCFLILISVPKIYSGQEIPWSPILHNYHFYQQNNHSPPCTCLYFRQSDCSCRSWKYGNRMKRVLPCGRDHEYVLLYFT